MVSTTSITLLNGLKDPRNETAWREFDARYRPIVIGFVRRLGIGEADAADVAQETLAQFAAEYTAGQCRRERCRLRTWLVGIAKHRAADLLSRQGRAARRRPPVQPAAQSAHDDIEELWLAEVREVIRRTALTELGEHTGLESRTVRAFELVVLEERPTADVARELGMREDSVYKAKHRCLVRLRVILAELNELYEID